MYHRYCHVARTQTAKGSALDIERDVSCNKSAIKSSIIYVTKNPWLCLLHLRRFSESLFIVQKLIVSSSMKGTVVICSITVFSRIFLCVISLYISILCTFGRKIRLSLSISFVSTPSQVLTWQFDPKWLALRIIDQFEQPPPRFFKEQRLGARSYILI